MANDIDYGAVLADLKAKRDALDNAIKGIERWLSLGGTDPTKDEPSQLAEIKADSVGTRANIFANLSIPDAIYQYLELEGSPRPLKNITSALKNGGLASTAKHLNRAISSTLTRLKKEKGSVVQRDGGWGLIQWYSGKQRTAAAAHGRDSQTALGTTKLTPDQVEQLKARRKEGRSQNALAKEFGISQGSVSRILRVAASI
jgi:hypothetical protein